MASALVNNVGLVAPECFLDLPPSATSAYSSFGWLSPRISFSRDFDGDDDDDGGKSKASLDAVEAAGDADLGSPGRDHPVVDFEFRRVDDPVTMLPADELFSDGKLVPLQLAPVRAAPVAVASPASAEGVPSLSSMTSSLSDTRCLLCDTKDVFCVCRLSAKKPAAAPSPSSMTRLLCDTRCLLCDTRDVPCVCRLSTRKPTTAYLPRVVGSDPYAVFSPKAPRCSSRWRELLGLKKAAQSGGGAKADAQRASSSLSSSSSPMSSVAPRSAATRSLKHFLHRNAKSSSSMDGSLSLPLLRDLDCESVSISARLSLSSSSSSGPDHEDLPRLSLDSDKPSLISISLGRNPPRVRLNPKPRPTVDPSLRPCSQVNEHMGHLSALAATPVAGAGGRVGRSPMRRPPGESTATGPSVDSPRMNSSGKVVFQSLERSSSSPSTFNGGPRVKHRGMERSYSANVVRVTPVLNVPVCSLRGSSKSGSVFGFGQLFSSSPHKKDGAAGASSSSAAARHSSCGSGRSGKIVRA